MWVVPPVNHNQVPDNLAKQSTELKNELGKQLDDQAEINGNYNKGFRSDEINNGNIIFGEV